MPKHKQIRPAKTIASLVLCSPFVFLCQKDKIRLNCPSVLFSRTNGLTDYPELFLETIFPQKHPIDPSLLHFPVMTMDNSRLYNMVRPPANSTLPHPHDLPQQQQHPDQQLQQQPGQGEGQQQQQSRPIIALTLSRFSEGDDCTAGLVFRLQDVGPHYQPDPVAAAVGINSPLAPWNSIYIPKHYRVPLPGQRQSSPGMDRCMNEMLERLHLYCCCMDDPIGLFLFFISVAWAFLRFESTTDSHYYCSHPPFPLSPPLTRPLSAQQSKSAPFSFSLLFFSLPSYSTYFRWII